MSETEAGLEEAVRSMVSAGKNSFDILTEGNGADYWEEITSAIRKLRLPLWVKLQNNTKTLGVYKIEEKENVYIAGSPAEVKKAIEAYQGRLDELELWYYNDTMDDNNQWSVVNGALYQTGYTVEAKSMTAVHDGMVQCHVEEAENVLRVDDLSEAVEYFRNNGMDALQEKNIWYATKDTDEWSLEKKLREVFISCGYLVDYRTDNMNYSEVIKFTITEATEVKYISGAQDLVSYVNSIGLENLVGTEFYVKNSQGKDAYDAVYELFAEAQYPVDYGLSDRGTVIGVYPDKIYEDVYISADEDDLKKDILDAKSKGILETVEFRLIDRTGKYDEESIKAIIESMNCNIIMDLMYYREGYHHEIAGARVIEENTWW